jgi:hypothetical protein
MNPYLSIATSKGQPNIQCSPDRPQKWLVGMDEMQAAMKKAAGANIT